MPIYEFKCSKCNRETEEIVKTGETGNKLKCPNCGNIGLEKRPVSTFAVGSPSPSCSLDGPCPSEPPSGPCCPGCRHGL